MSQDQLQREKLISISQTSVGVGKCHILLLLSITSIVYMLTEDRYLEIYVKIFIIYWLKSVSAEIVHAVRSPDFL